MNLPFYVNTSSLEVVAPVTGVDYISLGLSALGTLVGAVVGVVLGFALARWDRRRVEKIESLKMLINDVNYAVGLLLAMGNNLTLLLQAMNECGEVLCRSSEARIFTEVRFIEADFKRLAVLVSDFPMLYVHLSGLENAVDSLNFSIREYSLVVKGGDYTMYELAVRMCLLYEQVFISIRSIDNVTSELFQQAKQIQNTRKLSGEDKNRILKQRYSQTKLETMEKAQSLVSAFELVQKLFENRYPEEREYALLRHKKSFSRKKAP